MSEGPSPAELAGYVGVARDHREHERYHSVLKLEEAAGWRRDSNALKLLADRWSDERAAGVTVSTRPTAPSGARISTSRP